MKSATLRRIHVGHVLYTLLAVGLMAFGTMFAVTPANPNPFLPAELESQRHGMVAWLGVSFCGEGMAMIAYLLLAQNLNERQKLYCGCALALAILAAIAALCVSFLYLFAYVSYA